MIRSAKRLGVHFSIAFSAAVLLINLLRLDSSVTSNYHLGISLTIIVCFSFFHLKNSILRINLLRFAVIASTLPVILIFTMTQNLQRSVGSTGLYFICSVLLAGLIFFFRDKLNIRTIEESLPKNKLFYNVVIFIILAIALLVRFHNLGELSLWWDEILTGTYVTRILEVGYPLSPSGFEYYWRGIAYHYIVSAFAFVFGVTDFWIRVPSVLFGTGIIFLSYRIATRINPLLGIPTALLLCVSAYNLEYSQFARFYIMNSFLLLLNLELFWVGFFTKHKNASIFRFLSIVIFSIMLLTVQLGAIFLAIVAFWVLLKCTDSVLERNVKKMKDVFIFAPIFLIVYILGNPFVHFIGDYRPSPYTVTTIEHVDSNTQQVVFGLPKPEFRNIVVPFFDSNYIPIIFVVIGAMLPLAQAVHKIRPFLRVTYSAYIAGSVLFLLFLFELVNPYENEPRLYFMFEPFFLILGLNGALILSRVIEQKRNSFSFLLVIIPAILLLSFPHFLAQFNIKYGDDVSTNPFRTTLAQAYRTDSSGVINYINSTMREGDVWINTMEPAYGYAHKNPDYILNQNYKWKSMWREEFFTDHNHQYIDIRYNSVLINTTEDIERILVDNSDGNVFLTVNGSNLTALYTTHLNAGFALFIEENRDHIEYVAPDGLSMVLGFRK